MLELPEVNTLARQWNETLKGKVIQRAAANTSPHGFAFYEGDPAGYGELLDGKAIGEARALGGRLEVRMRGVSLDFFDGVNFRYLREGEKRPAKHQLLIEFEDGDCVACTVQMYGGLMAMPEGAQESPFFAVAREKPSPLTDAFDEAWFDGIVGEAKPTLSAKALLATEQRIPGLGNGCLQDILFIAGIHPKRKVRDMTDAQLGTLFRSVKSTLADMTEKGGRDTEKDLFAKPGGYKTLLSSKTYKQPCPNCGGEISRFAYMGGNVYVCPVCQPL